MELPESGFAVFWTLSISWSGKHSCANSEYLYIDILCCWTLKGSQDKDILCYRALNRQQDIDICVSEHQTDHRTDSCIQWISLTVSYMKMVRSDWFYYYVIV